MADDRPPAQGQCPTRNPKSPYKWSTGPNGDVKVTIERGTHKGKTGVVQKCGFEEWFKGGDMVYLIKLGNGSNVVVWSSDTAIVLDELVVPAGDDGAASAPLPHPFSQCMVVYGGV